MSPAFVRFAPGPAIGGEPGGKHPEAVYQQTLKGRSVLFPAGRDIRKLPLSQISQSMAGNQPIAVIAGPDPQRPLRPSCCQTQSQ